MSRLGVRMIEDMKLAGSAASTQAVYDDAARGLAAHDGGSPNQSSEEEVRAYLVGLRERGVARGPFESNRYGPVSLPPYA